MIPQLLLPNLLMSDDIDVIVRRNNSLYIYLKEYDIIPDHVSGDKIRTCEVFNLSSPIGGVQKITANNFCTVKTFVEQVEYLKRVMECDPDIKTDILALLDVEKNISSVFKYAYQLFSVNEILHAAKSKLNDMNEITRLNDAYMQSHGFYFEPGITLGVSSFAFGRITTEKTQILPINVEVGTYGFHCIISQLETIAKLEEINWIPPIHVPTHL